jgi:hypothetical protein
VTEFTCIYCNSNFPIDKCSTEHVVPQAFGRFEHNFTLTDCVCHDCNQYFGNNLEVIVARFGSLEAIHRLDKGIAPTDRSSFLCSDRVIFSLAHWGEWTGFIVELQDHEGQLVVTPVPQVRFRTRDRQDWIFIPEWYLKDLSNPLPAEVDTETAVPISAEVKESSLIETLSARNIKFPEGNARSLPISEGSRVKVDSITALDGPVKRLMAKIAFNYLAFKCKANFVLNRYFDPVRKYVRYGEEPGFEMISVTREPILADDSVTQRQTSGHLLTLNWPSNAPDIIGQMSLFNHLRYDILLARNPELVWRDINIGHHFDIENRQIKQIRHKPYWRLPGSIF